MSIIRQGTVTTCKPHNCWGCGRLMPKGTRMYCVVSTEDKKIVSTYWCCVCDALAGEFDPIDPEGVEYGAYLRNAPDEWKATKAMLEGKA